MTNLLPELEQNRIRRERHLRFVAAALIGASLVLLSGIAMLGPLLAGIWGRERAELGLLTFANRAPSGDDEISSEDAKDLLKTANNHIDIFTNILATPSVGSIFERLVSLSGEDISLKALLYTAKPEAAPEDAPAWTIEMRGSARTREALIALERRLERDPAVAQAHIPLEHFAADRNIGFSVTISGVPSDKQ